MSNDMGQKHALQQRLQRAGYIIGDTLLGADGITRTLVGKDRMTRDEMVALASQDTETSEKY